MRSASSGQTTGTRIAVPFPDHLFQQQQILFAGTSDSLQRAYTTNFVLYRVLLAANRVRRTSAAFEALGSLLDNLVVLVNGVVRALLLLIIHTFITFLVHHFKSSSSQIQPRVFGGMRIGAAGMYEHSL